LNVVRIAQIARTIGTANVVEWAKLALADLRAPVLRVTRLRHDDRDRPVALETVVLVLEHFPGLEANGDVIPDICGLAQRYGLSLLRTAERVGVVAAAGDIALHLGIAAGTKVLKLERVVQTAAGVPIEWRVSFNRL
jgi:DNA-binding GntR family transcriptional regulator